MLKIYLLQTGNQLCMRILPFMLINTRFSKPYMYSINNENINDNEFFAVVVFRQIKNLIFNLNE